MLGPAYRSEVILEALLKGFAAAEVQVGSGRWTVEDQPFVECFGVAADGLCTVLGLDEPGTANPGDPHRVHDVSLPGSPPGGHLTIAGYLDFKSPSRCVDFNCMRRGTATPFQGTAVESSVIAVLVVPMLVTSGAVIGDLAYGTLKGILEGAGLTLFVAAVLAGPVYAQKVRSRHDI